MSQKSTISPEGLRIPLEMSLAEMGQDELLSQFAMGLIPTALQHIAATFPLSTALYQETSALYPLWTVLLALDAELEGVVEGTSRLFPLPGFFSYRASLTPDKISPRTLRLPPLNPGGHFILSPIASDSHLSPNGRTPADGHLAVRLDLEPTSQILGHVRLAVSRPDRFPFRLRTIEHRLDRQVLTEAIVSVAVAEGQAKISPPLTTAEVEGLVQTLLALRVG